MKISVEIGAKNYQADMNKPLDITIPVDFSGSGLTAFGAPAASSVAYAAGDYIGDVQQGGSCNCEVLTFAPHLHGTHTECVGHISHERICIADVFKGGISAATLITMQPVTPMQTDETYAIDCAVDDALITKEKLQNLIKNNQFLESLIIRTSPNKTAKISGEYSTNMPAFFTTQAMEFIVELGVKNLLIDTPSVDRLDDEGKLSNHHIFWNITQGSHQVDAVNPSPKTITELIYVADEIADGNYLLDLQVAALMMDAAPSHPILYEVTEI